ncbi:lysylphosphatidylglycerol synthase transmembrane domain-containing protein [Natrarchaeobaculum sulfurireducens]|uniref:lysylphosphatidylglycerol synthase transmembrane domain-containing protein n=1 Tax=Natrarchaeobaculum sulfurireducens TaxID=2044521 RepID=UPI000E3DC7C5|nr:lysylphosphatidylglycerol synthase transmembrane domain-containing protein [Natrarchaeobaculum sulfurireducens]
MNRKLLLWTVGIAVLAGLTVAAGWADIRTAIGRGNPLVLAGLALVQILTFFIISYQWQYLFRRADVTVSFRRILEVTLAAGFVESVTPSSKLGGMAAKVYLFERTTDAAYGTITSVLLAQKYVSMLPFVLIAIAAVVLATVQLEIPITPTVSSSAVVAVGLVGGLVASVSLWFHRRDPDDSASDWEQTLSSHVERWRGVVRSLIQEASALLDRRSRWWLYGISLLLWGLYPIKIYVVAVTLGLDVGLAIVVVGTFLAYIVGLAPISPGGTGTFEGTLALVLVGAGATFAEGLSVALLARLITFWFPLALSGVVTISLIVNEDEILPDGVLARVSRRLRRVRG